MEKVVIGGNSMSKENFLDGLSKSERKIHDYIKKETDKSNGRFSQSMSKIGEAVGVSEATVHRAVRQLKKSGVIGVVASAEKAESNEIIYYGEPDEEEQVQSIITMASQLNSDIDRFQSLMEAKDSTIRTMERERALLLKQLGEQEEKLKNYKNLVEGLTEIVSSYEDGHPVLSEKNIVGYTELGEGNSALIFKVK